MAYDEKLAERIRTCLKDVANVEEKKMMGGLTFMVNDKMCVGIIKNELLCRIDPTIHDDCLKKPGVKTMEFTKRPMSGFIQVDPTYLNTKKDLEAWIELSLEFNPKAKSSKKKK